MFLVDGAADCRRAGRRPPAGGKALKPRCPWSSPRLPAGVLQGLEWQGRSPHVEPGGPARTLLLGMLWTDWNAETPVAQAQN